MTATVDVLVGSGTPTEILAARHEAETLREHARRCHLGYRLAFECSKARWLLEHRFGELLKGRVARGRPKNVPTDDNFRLGALAVSRNLSSRAQSLAKVPLPVLLNYFDQCQEAEADIEWTGLKSLYGIAEAESRPASSYFYSDRTANASQWCYGAGKPRPSCPASSRDNRAGDLESTGRRRWRCT
jgi:hypothetical protein